jgi:hypothetical protein
VGGPAGKSVGGDLSGSLHLAPDLIGHRIFGYGSYGNKGNYC